MVHTYSGMENRVKVNLENRISSLNMEDFIFQVEVPQEEVSEIKNGQRRKVRRTVLPGYILVRMELSDESWGGGAAHAGGHRFRRARDLRRSR